MVNLEQRIESLYHLVNWLNGYFTYVSKEQPGEYLSLETQIQNAHIYNQWLIAPFIRNALDDFRKFLTHEQIEFFKIHLDALKNDFPEKKIVILPSQNIPLSGAIELIITFIAGFKIILRNNNHKDDLLYFVTQKLISIHPGIARQIQWTDWYPKDMDAWIFHDKPEHEALYNYFEHRKALFIPLDRSISVIFGNETRDELTEIADKIFIYWGFSSGNIRKIYVPKGYNFNQLFEAMEKYSFLYQYNCYANNYDYHKSVLLMNLLPFLDNGFILLREDHSMNAPIGCVYYEYYENSDEVVELAELSKKETTQRYEKRVQLIIDFLKNI